MVSLVALALFVAVAYGPATAQPYAIAGISLPVGDFADAYKTGFHLGGGYDHPVTPQASVGIRGAFSRHSQDVGDGHVQMIELLGTGKLTSQAGVFAFAGLGVTFTSGESDGEDFDGESNFTAAIGGGYQVQQWEFSAIFHTVDSEGGSADYVTLSAGIRF
jgi:hypothetical protein